MVGSTDGAIVGIAVAGDFDGPIEGKAVGILEGDSDVGDRLGLKVGSCDGLTVGTGGCVGV